ncbi:HdeD family acid-resistance protein [Halobacteriaceae archaeon GCM10025711]
MSTDAGTGTEVGAAEQTTIEEGWEYMMGAGAIMAVMGLLAVIFPFVTGVALSLLLGGLLVVGAIAHVVNAFSARRWTGSLVQIVLAIIYVVAGISLLANPVLGLATLTVLLIAFLLVGGLVEIVMGVRIRPEQGWGWVIASGVVSLVLAGLIWAGLPSSAAWAVGLLFGVHLLSSGISMMLVARGGRNAARATPTTGETSGV